MKSKEKSTIQAMWRTIQMWWLIRHLQSYCLVLEGQEFEIDRRGKRSVRHTSFTAHVALNQVIRFKPLWLKEGEKIPCPSCNPEEYKQCIGEENAKKVSMKMAYYDLLVRLAIKYDYIVSKEGARKKAGDKRKGLCMQFVRLTEEGEELTGISDLLVLLLTKYKVLWAIPTIPSVAYLLGTIFG